MLRSSVHRKRPSKRRHVAFRLLSLTNWRSWLEHRKPFRHRHVAFLLLCRRMQRSLVHRRRPCRRRRVAFLPLSRRMLPRCLQLSAKKPQPFWTAFKFRSLLLKSLSLQHPPLRLLTLLRLLLARVFLASASWWLHRPQCWHRALP